MPEITEEWQVPYDVVIRPDQPGQIVKTNGFFTFGRVASLGLTTILVGYILFQVARSTK